MPMIKVLEAEIQDMIRCTSFQRHELTLNFKRSVTSRIDKNGQLLEMSGTICMQAKEMYLRSKFGSEASADTTFRGKDQP